MTQVTIGPLVAAERDAWSGLWRAYLGFYRTELPEERYAATWGRMLRRDGLFGLGARGDGSLVGIVHYLFHPSTWADEVCYLQDLFVDPGCRGGGVGKALIEAVAEAARARGVARLYWLTQEDNATARRLYEAVAQYRGFIRYDYRL